MTQEPRQPARATFLPGRTAGRFWAGSRGRSCLFALLPRHGVEPAPIEGGIRARLPGRLGRDVCQARTAGQTVGPGRRPGTAAGRAGFDVAGAAVVRLLVVHGFSSQRARPGTCRHKVSMSATSRRLGPGMPPAARCGSQSAPVCNAALDCDPGRARNASACTAALDCDPGRARNAFACIAALDCHPARATPFSATPPPSA